MTKLTAPPDFSDIVRAQGALRDSAVETPLIESAALNERTGGRILLKLENLQRTGTFKFRGAWTRIGGLDRASAPGGVVAFSSGNHAQGVAAAAALRGLPALIVMPHDTPAIKVENTRALGAEIVFYNRDTENREMIAQSLAEARGAILVPPYDDPAIIAGQGTVGLELVQQAAARGLVPDEVIVPASGGGLLAGVSLAVRELCPNARIWSAEPEHHNDHAQSFAAGERVRVDATEPSICDALLTPIPGALTFSINRSRVSGGLVANDAQVLQAMAYAFRVLKIVLEPAGAMPLAILLSGRIPAKDKIVALVLSGGNVDATLFARAISSSETAAYN